MCLLPREQLLVPSSQTDRRLLIFSCLLGLERFHRLWALDVIWHNCWLTSKHIVTVMVLDVWSEWQKEAKKITSCPRFQMRLSGERQEKWLLLETQQTFLPATRHLTAKMDSKNCKLKIIFMRCFHWRLFFYSLAESKTFLFTTISHCFNSFLYHLIY